MDILQKEIIDLDMEVVDAINPKMIGLSGRIVNETRDTLIIENHKEKKLQKNQIVFKLKKGNKTYKINGNTIKKRPEERIKLR